MFWTYWLISAFTAKRTTSWAGGRGAPLRAVTGIIIAVFLRLSYSAGVRGGTLSVNSPVLQTVGIVLLLCGLLFAVWARIHLGRNWGMPMTQREDPELVTSGPYTCVRHPVSRPGHPT